MKSKLVFSILTVAAVLLAGCATGHGKHAGCGKCACKMMQASATDPHKCANCGHSDFEHDKPAQKTSGTGTHVH